MNVYNLNIVLQDMKISKKAEYAIKAVISIARHKDNKPLHIGEISKKESIPIKFLEQILLNLKKSGILNSKRGTNGGYLLAKSKDIISIGMILKIIDGPFDPIDFSSGSDLSSGLEKCFREMREMVNNHLNGFTIQDVIELEESEDIIAFEI